MIPRIAALIFLGLAACGTKADDDPCAAACCDCPFVWQALPAAGAPSARSHHSAVWTGKEMIVWGGLAGPKATVSGDGAVYDPSTDRWRPVTAAGAPTARHSHSAVWTGSAMLVWGGYGDGGYATGGGSYDPTSDTWKALPAAGEPTGRTNQSAVWTGKELVIFGGFNGMPVASGGRFDPAAGSWKATASGPASRLSHAAVWSGSEMLVWGGTNTFDWLADGRRYKPDGDSWGNMLTPKGAPSARESATALWTGAAMLLWGGWNGFVYKDDGALYDPAGDAWTAMASGAPAARKNHVSAWTGKELFVWGGCGDDACGTVFSDGGRYKDGRWTLVPANPLLAGRAGATAVWTGREVIVFGGVNAALDPLPGGARARM